MSHELLKRILTSLVLLPILIYSTYYSGIYFILFLSFIYIFSFYEVLKNTKNLLIIAISNIVLIFSLYCFFTLRGDTNYSLLTIYWILMATFFSDIGGYLFGKIFKGKKLTKISPNKTYSGSIGSIILSTSSLIFLGLLQKIFFDENLINFFQFKYFLITIFISIICQIGDLYVSFWKRKINIKNISNILPGHGGVLDRIDGLIFVLIFSFMLLKIGFI